MTYVFIFLGEFGYELLNWHGVIRKFATTLGPEDRIVCCSRAGLAPLYDVARMYIDISGIPRFKRSVACMYSATSSRRSGLGSGILGIVHTARLKDELRVHILKTLGIPARRIDAFNLLDPRKPHWKDPDGVKLVFSSDRAKLKGCLFGMDPSEIGRGMREGDIYEGLDLDNNVYRRIEPDESVRREIERSLGFSLTEPFVLCQERRRQIVVRSDDRIPREGLIEAMSRRCKVVVLSFVTGRCLDSYSSFAPQAGCFSYECRSFREQSCLIAHARHCVFFTEGDFGSHIYLPPFMGRDVTAIAPFSVYQLGTTPIEFWNREVFRFGGQIIPRVAEEVFASAETLDEVALAATAG